MPAPDIFALTQRPAAELLYRRGDPHDPRLGEIVRTAPEDYAAAQVVLLGFPYDEGVRRNHGRPGAAQAPTAIRRALYRLSGQPLPDHAFFDLGDIPPAPTLEAVHAAAQQVLGQVLADGKRLVVLGGGNDLSYSTCGALSRHTPGLAAFNIDLHFDVRQAPQLTSGTPYRQLLQEGLLSPDRFYQIGSLPFANSPAYRRWLEEQGVGIYTLDMLRGQGVAAFLQTLLQHVEAEVLFWGVDMDVVRASDAPGVSAPNPLGISGEDLCQITALAGQDRRTRILEITEVNPLHDVDDRTSRLAAVAVFYFLSGLSRLL